jgi:pyridoxamine 5'-phosphate oxidase
MSQNCVVRSPRCRPNPPTVDPVLNPLALLAEDRNRARAANDAMAALCVLATVDANGLPHARTLVLRDLQDRLALFMNTTSPKHAQLSTAPASLCLYLPSIQVQYRAHVDLEPIDASIIAESWHLRPAMPKVLEWFYTGMQSQSTAVPSRSALKDAITAMPLPEQLVAPATACGFWLNVLEMERLDLAQTDGLHDRRRFSRHTDGWSEVTLLP